MPVYLVRWEIDIEADTPEEAARKARAIQLNPETTANVFDVIADGESTRIDLLELDHPEEAY